MKTPKTTTGGDRPATTDADALGPDAQQTDALHTDAQGAGTPGTDAPLSETPGSDAQELSNPESVIAAPTSGAPGFGADTDGPSGPEIRRIPAHVGVIPSTETGTGTPAQAGQPGEVTPIDSTLVGAGGAWSAAAPRPGTPLTEADEIAADDSRADDRPEGDSGATPFGAAQHRDGRSPTPTSTSTPTPAPAPARRSGFWPLALGGAVAAGLGAAATLYALPHLPPEWRPAGPAATATPGDLPDREALMAEAAQAGRQAAEEVLAQAAPATAPDAGAEATPAQDLPQDLAARLEALEQRPQDAAQTEAAEARLAELVQRLDDQQARLDELAARPAFDPEAAGALEDRIQTAAAEARSALDEVRAQSQELQDAAEDSTRRAEAVAAIAALQGALDAGVTPEEARTALEGVGLEPPEALQTPVPALTELQEEFPEAARAALRASLRETSASGEGNLFTNFLRAQTGARSVAPREGDDPDAILSRADAHVQAGRIDAALTEAEALPEAARAAPAMAQWLERGAAYSQARSALSDLSPGTN